MKNTAEVTGGKPIAVLLQSISGVSDINPLVAFYDIHGGQVLFFYFFPDTTDTSATPSGIKHEWYVYLLCTVNNIKVYTFAMS
jgi:hypothetical protein